MPASKLALKCEKCGRSADRVTLVPEFNFMGCDDCHSEALRAIAAEAANPAVDEVRRERLNFLLKTALTPEEIWAFAEAVKTVVEVGGAASGEAVKAALVKLPEVA